MSTVFPQVMHTPFVLLLWVHMHIVLRLFNFISTIDPVWAYSLVFITSFADGLPFVGIFSPGGAATVVAGFLCRRGGLHLDVTIYLAFVGALAGDMIGYAVGKYRGYSFLKKYGRLFFMKEEERIEKTRNLVVSNPGKSIVFGRFYYLTRSISPFLAGASNISFGTFLAYDLIGTILWAFTHVLGGFIFGRGFEILARYLGFAVLIIALLAVIAFYLHRLLKRKHEVFMKYHIYTLAVNLFCIYLFAKTIQDVTEYHTLFKLDHFIQSHMHYLWTPLGISFFSLVTNLGGAYVVSLVSLTILFILARRKQHWYYSLLFFLSIISGTVSQFAIKYLTALPRPPSPLVSTDYFSFPSGHATLIMLLGILIPYCFWHDMKTKTAKWLSVVASFAVVLTVSFSRLYLNAHWMTDVLAGLALGAFWVTFYILLLRSIDRLV